MLTIFFKEYTPGHLPDLLNPDSLIDVLTLCNFCILSNVLDFRTYSFINEPPTAQDLDKREQWDLNAISRLDREYFIYVRGLAINFIRWLSCNFDAKPIQPHSPMLCILTDICGRYLSSQACTILNYKKRSEAEDLVTIPHCSYMDIRSQLEYLFEHSGQEKEWCGDWKSNLITFQNQTSMCFDTKFTVSRKHSPDEFTGMH